MIITYFVKETEMVGYYDFFRENKITRKYTKLISYSPKQGYLIQKLEVSEDHPKYEFIKGREGVVLSPKKIKYIDPITFQEKTKTIYNIELILDIYLSEVEKEEIRIRDAMNNFSSESEEEYDFDEFFGFDDDNKDSPLCAVYDGIEPSTLSDKVRRNYYMRSSRRYEYFPILPDLNSPKDTKKEHKYNLEDEKITKLEELKKWKEDQYKNYVYIGFGHWLPNEDTISKHKIRISLCGDKEYYPHLLIDDKNIRLENKTSIRRLINIVSVLEEKRIEIKNTYGRMYKEIDGCNDINKLLNINLNDVVEDNKPKPPMRPKGPEPSTVWN